MIRNEVRLLYKYRGYDIDIKSGVNRTSELLRCKEIWYSTLPSFNDPFECLVNIDNTIEAGSLLGHAIIRHLNDGHSVDSALKIIKDSCLDSLGNIASHVTQRIAKACDEFHLENNTLGVMALCEDPLSILTL